MQKTIIIIGIVLILVGMSWPLLKALNIGHLPGDIVIKKENFSFYFPIVTCIIISVVVSVIFWLFNRK